RRAILDAAFELWLELGHTRLTIEAIAARAGVGKQTIYRWWPSKSAVVLDAFLEAAEVENAFPTTDDLASDLKGQIKTVIKTLNDPRLGPQLRSLIAESQHDEAIAEEVHKRLIAPRYALVYERLRRAQERGQLRGDVDVKIAAELFYAPIWHRALLHTAPLTPDQADKVVEAALAGLAPPGSRRSPSKRSAH